MNLRGGGKNRTPPRLAIRGGVTLRRSRHKNDLLRAELALNPGLFFPFDETLHRSAADGARSLHGRPAVFHRHLVSILYLGLLFAFDAICLSHRSCSSFSITIRLVFRW